MTKFRVWMHSQPGMWEFYSGKVDVFAENPDEAQTGRGGKLNAPLSLNAH